MTKCVVVFFDSFNIYLGAPWGQFQPLPTRCIDGRMYSCNSTVSGDISSQIFSSKHATGTPKYEDQ